MIISKKKVENVWKYLLHLSLCLLDCGWLCTAPQLLLTYSAWALIWIHSDVRGHAAKHLTAVLCRVKCQTPVYCTVKTCRSLSNIWNLAPKQPPVTGDELRFQTVAVHRLSSFHSVCPSRCAPPALVRPSEGLLDTPSEPLNSTWQGVAPSNTSNVTARLGSQTRGEQK